MAARVYRPVASRCLARHDCNRLKKVTMNPMFRLKNSPRTKVAGLLVLPFLIWTMSCSDKKAAQGPPPQAMPVQVKTAAPATVPETTEYVATLKSRETAVISPQVE